MFSIYPVSTGTGRHHFCSLSNLLALVFTTHTHRPFPAVLHKPAGWAPDLSLSRYATHTGECVPWVPGCGGQEDWVSGPYKSKTIAESSWQATTPRAMHRQQTETYSESSCVKSISTWLGASAWEAVFRFNTHQEVTKVLTGNIDWEILSLSSHVASLQFTGTS